MLFYVLRRVSNIWVNLKELGIVIFLLLIIAVIYGSGDILIRGVLVVFSVLFARDVIIIGLSEDLLATPLFPCIIVFDFVFGVLLIFAGVILIINPINNFVDDLRLLDTH